jgi:hypothetical protein
MEIIKEVAVEDQVTLKLSDVQVDRLSDTLNKVLDQRGIQPKCFLAQLEAKVESYKYVGDAKKVIEWLALLGGAIVISKYASEGAQWIYESLAGE